MSDSDNDNNDHLNTNDSDGDFSDESDEWEEEEEEELPHEVIIDGEVYGLRSEVTEITVRAGVTSIPNRCCINCVNLTSVILPASVQSIGRRAFEGCKSLRNIALPKSLSSIGYYCFWASGLESIVIPNSVTTLGDDGNDGGVFGHCSSLAKVVLPNSLSSIPKYTFHSCFNSCKSLKSLVIPDSVRSIDVWAFHHCTSLASINIPDNATVAADSFEGCAELIAIAAASNMKVRDYFRTSHLKKLHDEKIKPRAIVLLCLKFINARRMKETEDKRRRINSSEGSSNNGGEAVVVGRGGDGGGGHVYISDQSFKGVLAESKITAFEMWREIVMYL